MEAGPIPGALLGVDAVAIDAMLDQVKVRGGDAIGWLAGHGADREQFEKWAERSLSPDL